jgi:hypothetical protein
MTVSNVPNSTVLQKRKWRLYVARWLYQALIARNADRLITLRDESGRVVARHDPRPEQIDDRRSMTH